MGVCGDQRTAFKSWFSLCKTNNTNPETDLWFKLKTRKARQPDTREFFFFFTSTNTLTEGVILSSDCICFHQTSDSKLNSCLFSFILLSPPSHITPVSTYLVLGFQVLGLKVCDSQTLGTKGMSHHHLDLFLGPSCVAQGSIELTEICLPPSPKSWD